ncbi:DUF1330 domain-containing protein [Pararhizobium sp. IMCC21322]|uniref:DUF1330 domain-containing protein n=1 Tax=Pararhizobium sp. IMCC21322 TaxID=3067903 RepID=UPI0027412E70|nr:DUF1330 domain-containing protein [Pararhizobium sp. IMCC21322]
MSGFVIHHYNIIDRSRVDELGPLTLPIAEKYGADVIVASPVKALTGKTYSHMVIYQLESFEAALSFLHSPEMKGLEEMRNQIIEGFAAVVPGHTETADVVKSGYFD